MLTCAAHQPQGATHSPSIRPSTRLSTPAPSYLSTPAPSYLSTPAPSYLCTPAPSYQWPEAEGIPPRWRPGRYLYSVHLKPNPNPSPNPNPNQVPVLCAPQAEP